MTTYYGDNNANSMSGTSGNDTFHAYGGADTINISAGGSDTVYADAGNDTINAGSSLSAGDHIDGGTGTDTVVLNGSYSLSFNATTMVNVENLTLVGNHNYNLSTDDATVAAGAQLNVDAGALGAGYHLTFTGFDETNGHFRIVDSSGNDDIRLGAGDDIIYLDHGGFDSLYAGAGDDTIYAGAGFDAGDLIDGEGGYNTLVLHGDYTAAHAVFFGNTTIHGIQRINVLAGYSYKLILNAASVFDGANLMVDATGLAAGQSLTLDASAVADTATFTLYGGAGNDVFTGNNMNNIFHLEHGGSDFVKGGSGNDTFYMGAGLDAGDVINAGTGTGDVLDLNGNYGAGLTFLNSTMSGIDVLLLEPVFDYKLTLAAGNVAAGATLVVNGQSLAGGDVLTLDSTAINNANLTVYGGLAPDTVKTGGGADQIHFEKGGSDTASTGAGDDRISFDTTFDATDKVDGGAGGTDWIILNGDYTGAHAVVMNASTMTNIEVIGFNAGHSYSLTLNDGNLATGQSLILYGVGMGASDVLTFNAAAETDASITFGAGAGNDVLTGGGGADVFVLGNGGNDVVKGGGGDDVFNFGAAFTFADQVDGGAGNDTLNLDGNYAGVLGLFFNAATLVNVENIVVAAGHSYTMTLNDTTVAAGQTLNINAGALGAANALTVNGVFETDGALSIIGGAGNDVLTGGAGADTFNLVVGGIDTLDGGGGDDTFIFNATFTAQDQVVGGTGNDTVDIYGDYTGAHAVTLLAGTMTGVEKMVALGGLSYDLTFNDGNVAAGATLTIDGSDLGAGDVLKINGAAELDGAYAIIGGAGADVLTGGAGADTFEGGDGNDAITGGAGGDTASYAHASAAVTVDAGLAGAQDTLGAGVDTLSGIENIIGSDFNDTLTAAGAGSSLSGGLGNDTLLSGAGDDTLDGGAGGDTVSYAGAGAGVTVNLTLAGAQNTGGAGMDTLIGVERISGSAFDDKLTGNGSANLLIGGQGADILNGGAGQDTLKGGAGNDTFLFSSLVASTVAAPDLIQDFTAGDKIDVHALDADTGVAGDQAFHVGGGGGHAGDILVTYDAVNNRTVLDFFVDNDAQADARIWLTGDHSGIAAGDFVL